MALLMGGPAGMYGPGAGFHNAAQQEHAKQQIADPWFLVQLAVMFAIPGAIAFITQNQEQVWLYLDQLHRRWRNESVRSITFTYSSDYWSSYKQDDRNNILQKAITMYIAEHCKSTVPRLKTGQVRLVNSDDNAQARWGGEDDDELSSQTLKQMRFAPLPARAEFSVIEPGLEIMIKETPDENAGYGEQKTIHEYSFRAYGPDSKSKIDDFIMRAYKYYIGILRKEIDISRYLFQMQVKEAYGEAASKPPVYKKYKLTDDKTFDSLFFEGKEEILALIDDFSNKRGKFAIEGFPNKLGLLLHGPPGTGKTSFVKALAAHTNRHIVTVPLAKINTNQDLYDIMFELVFPTVDDEGVNQQMTFRDIIFLMEDIDASADIVKSRKAAEESKENALKSMLAGDKKAGGDGKGDELDPFEMMQMMLLAESSQQGNSSGKDGKGTGGEKWVSSRADKLDLAGLLNVLDGVVDSPGRIVIMTTNHPEALDAALVRPGRINTKLHMDYMSDKCILEMFAHHFADATKAERTRVEQTLVQKRMLSTHGFKMSGAEVEQLCAECDTAEEFITELEEYPRLHKDLKAQIADYN